MRNQYHEFLIEKYLSHFFIPRRNSLFVSRIPPNNTPPPQAQRKTKSMQKRDELLLLLLECVHGAKPLNNGGMGMLKLENKREHGEGGVNLENL